MEKTILNDIPLSLDLNALMENVRVEVDSPFAEELASLAANAQGAIRPKAVYRMGYIESRGEETVVIDGVTFCSRILRVNLEQAHRVFIYAATCGREIYEWTESLKDLLHRYWAETIQRMALGAAVQAMNEHITAHHRPGRTATMSPGRLGDWPLNEQRPLFELLGDTRTEIGVELLPSLLMAPPKTVSGIRFPTEDSFESCQLCPRQDCPGRKAPYDQTLYDRRFRPGAVPSQRSSVGEEAKT
jgi:hypothetical protein